MLQTKTNFLGEEKMKKTITTFVLAAILMIGSSVAFAGDGIIIAGFSNDPCVQNENTARAGSTTSSKDTSQLRPVSKETGLFISLRSTFWRD